MIDIIDSPLHQQWLRNEELRLVDFARRVVRDDDMGAWLVDDGQPDTHRAGYTYVTGRMAYVHYLAALRGVPGARERAVRLLRGLDTTARDHHHGGWRERHDDDGSTDKSAYAHSFVVLASATGTLAGDPDAKRLLEEVLEVVNDRFWEPDVGLFADTWSGDWSTRRPYRGLNVNMHLVESMMAATDATGDPEWANRATSVVRFVLDRAAENSWRIPEHYDAQWRPALDYHRATPNDQFKPYGATIGHAFEWARLIVCTPAVSAERSRFVEGARELYARAVTDGWARNGHDGFVYTTDWEGQPVVTTRLHWVTTEAIGAAATLARTLDEPRYADEYLRWWGYADHFQIDRDHGSWHHELTEFNQPTATIWSGKPDLYHAYQATLAGQLAPATSFAAAILSRTGNEPARADAIASE